MPESQTNRDTFSQPMNTTQGDDTQISWMWCYIVSGVRDMTAI